MILRFFLFLILNFGALAIGGFFTGDGVRSDWYFTLQKAPWTPPGWVFGAAWSTIMLLFSLYMSRLWPHLQNKKELAILYVLQWILNVSWNPAFFYFHQIEFGLVIIILLTILIAYFLFNYLRLLRIWTICIVPYLVWLCIATSLNVYLAIYN